MGLKDTMINLVGDFVQMNRNPEYRSKSELNTAGTSGGLTVPNLQQRRHSLQITVGTEGPPDTFVRPRTYSVCGGDNVSVPSKSPNASQKRSQKNRRSSAPCILKEPPTFQLSSRRNRKTSESNENTETDSSTITTGSRRPIIKKQQSEEIPELSDSSDDAENSDFQRRRMKQNSPRHAGHPGFFNNGSFRDTIEEEPECEISSSPCINPNVTIITTRF